MAASSEVIGRPSFADLQGSILTASPADIRRLTHEWIQAQGDLNEQYQGILELLELAGTYIEGISEVVLEAWSALIDGQTWRAKFASRAQAEAKLDTPLLKDTRARAHGIRTRKRRTIKAL